MCGVWRFWVILPQFLRIYHECPRISKIFLLLTMFPEFLVIAPLISSGLLRFWGIVGRKSILCLGSFCHQSSTFSGISRIRAVSPSTPWNFWDLGSLFLPSIS